MRLKTGIFLLIILGLAVVTGCIGGEMETAQNGDFVKVDYTGTLDDGSIFDSSEGRQPLEFTLGQGQMIAGFEKAVLGMKLNETKTVTIPAAEAYGERREELIMTLDRSQMPADLNPEVGQQLQMLQPSGAAVNVTVTAVSDTTVTIDANHALAGKDLTFKITLVELQKASS